MKTIVTLLLIFIAAVATTNAQSRSHYPHKKHNIAPVIYVSGKTACGCKIYTKKIFNGYDRRGYKTFKYVSLPYTCNCKRNNYYASGYNKPKYKTNYRSYNTYYKGNACHSRKGYVKNNKRSYYN